MKKLMAGMAGLAASFSAAAYGQSLETLNPNAVAEVFSRAILQDAGNGVKANPYVSKDNFSLMCVGKIPQEPIDPLDAKGKSQAMNPQPAIIVEIMKDPKYEGTEEQKKLKDWINNRSDLVYLQFTSVGGPGAGEIQNYFIKHAGQKPLLTAQMGTGLRDGSLQTLFMTEKKSFEDFIAANKSEIAKVSAAYKDGYRQFWSDCGLKFPNK